MGVRKGRDDYADEGIKEGLSRASGANERKSAETESGRGGAAVYSSNTRDVEKPTEPRKGPDFAA